ncbi:MAG TPA: LacI family DNA-binding transcriptional regulator [Usitatibacteraceae bacterium]|nr:LacI family DNA-binding transcriptional regulator [Usitatibacteraceae bacterium]
MSPPSKPARRSRRGSGAVTLHDVARLAGVAPITASRALRTPERVSDEVRAKVLQAVARTGYVPNLMAGGLASTRSRLVAAVLPTIAAPVFLDYAQSLTGALAEAGYQVMVGQAGYAGTREDALLEAIIGRRPDGIVLTGIVHSAEGRKRLLASGIPVVETWDLTPTPIDMLVGFSHEEVGRAVARYLHGKGRRLPAVLAGDDARARRRFEAFRAEALALGLAEPPVAVVTTPTTLRHGREGLARLLRGRRIDSVFCSSDLLAMGALTEARVRGVRVPEDLAVVGFGDLEFSGDTSPSLTTVRIHGAEIGRHAARFIVERAEGRDPGPRIIDLGFSVIARESA